ncbi:MAG: metallophosphoesterase [Terracidiphilus sp.]
MLLAVFLYPSAEAGSPAPAPPEPSPTFNFTQFAPGVPLRLAVYGDTRFAAPNVTRGINPRVRRWLAERIAIERPQALLLTGDTPFIGARASDWQAFQEETAGWRANHILTLPATGNHEGYGGLNQGIANFIENFPAISGHRYYSALLGSVEVISLDCTSGSNRSSPQVRWFAAQLDHLPAQVEFLLILYHIPWMADRQSQIVADLPSRDALLFRETLEARLGRIHARVVVFNGHIHNYERFERRGVEYVVTGGGGAEPYPLLLRGHEDLYRDTSFPVYHYLTLEIADHTLHGTMWKVKDPDTANLAVEARDHFFLKASPVAAAAPQALPGAAGPPAH